MTANRHKKLNLSLLGGHVVECFDNTLYGFFAIMLTPLFFPSISEHTGYLASYGAFAAGFIARPLGALFFGFIHGMGFANYFRALLMDESSIFVPLLGFNLGIEFGQLIIVLFIVATAFLFTSKLRTNDRDWNVFISGAGFSLALALALENSFW